MAGGGSGEEADYWPGYVDALTAMVKVLCFVMMLLSVAVFVLSQNISKQLIETIAQVAEVDIKSGGTLDQMAKQITEKIQAQQEQMKEMQQNQSPDSQSQETKSQESKSQESKAQESLAKVQAAEEKTKAAEQSSQSQAKEVAESKEKAKEAQSKAQSSEEKAKTAQEAAQVQSKAAADSKAEAKEAQSKAQAAEEKTKAALEMAQAQMQEAKAQMQEAKAQMSEASESKAKAEDSKKAMEEQQKKIEELQKQLALAKELAAPGFVPGGSVANLADAPQSLNVIATDQIITTNVNNATAAHNSEFIITYPERIFALDDKTTNELGKYALLPDGILKAKSIELRGYADTSLGAITDARRIAFYRTMRVREVLIKNGIPANKLSIKVVDVVSIEEGKNVKIAGQK